MLTLEFFAVVVVLPILWLRQHQHNLKRKMDTILLRKMALFSIDIFSFSFALVESQIKTFDKHPFAIEC